jgi:ADP-ribosyl-[dinitrogen reductase] hydrolase
MNKLDKIKGALFGLAIGDALGGTTEFMKESDIKQKYGYLTEIIGSGIWNLEAGETTDDTAMTLAVAKGILDNPLFPIESIGEEFLEWKKTNPKDIGVTIQYALSYYYDKNDWDGVSKKVHDMLGGQSAGNGTLMRCLPVALSYKTLSMIDDVTVKQSKLTHYDDLANEACIIYNHIAYDLLNNKLSLKKSIQHHIQNTIYQNVIYNEPRCLPTGFVVDTFTWVLYTLYNKEMFEEIVQTLANKGEDSDTTAAIAGGLKGLEVGYNQLPKRYKEAILLKGELIDISEKIYELNK